MTVFTENATLRRSHVFLMTKPCFSKSDRFDENVEYSKRSVVSKRSFSSFSLSGYYTLSGFTLSRPEIGPVLINLEHGRGCGVCDAPIR